MSNPYPTPDSHNTWSTEPPVTSQGNRSPQGLEGDERAAAIMAHLSAPIAALISAGSLSLLGPLAIWFIYRKKSAAVRQAAAGAFNFNLAVWIWYWIGWACAITFIGFPVAIAIWTVIFIASIWCHIRGAMAANSGKAYRYPFQIRVLS